MRWPWTHEIEELHALLAARETAERIKRGHLDDALTEIAARKKQERTDNDPLAMLVAALDAYLA